MRARKHRGAGHAQFARAMCCVVLLIFSPLSQANSVVYGSYDLPDVVVGEDLRGGWYEVGGPLGAFGTWNVLFGADLYRSLVVTGNDAPGVLSALVSEPVPVLGADGQLTVTALSAVDGGFRGRVSVSYVWLGGGEPGPQTYQMLDDGFNEVGYGETVLAVPAVPEPEIAVLSLLGGGLLALRTRRKPRP